MKTIYQLYFLLAFLAPGGLLQAQNIFPCSPNGTLPLYCDNSCVYCNLDGLVASNDGFSQGGIVVCGQIVMQRPRWLGFVAGTSTIQIRVDALTSQTGDGLQLAIFQGCDYNALVCNPGATSGAFVPLIIQYNQFVPGQVYFLMVDGYLDDVCDFQIDVVDGATGSGLAGPTEMPAGPSVICPGGTAVYSIPLADNASYYEWTAPGGSYFSNNWTPLNTGQQDPSATITFGNSSGQVCVRGINVCGSPGPFSCKNVSLQQVPPTDLPDLVIPAFELPYFWAESPYTQIQSSGTYNLVSSHYPTDYGCDSIVLQQITALPNYPDGVVGILYHDYNNNGIRDFNEPLYNGGLTVSTSLGQSTSLTNNGYFVFSNVQSGEVVFVQPPSPNAEIHPGSYVVEPGASISYDFGIYEPAAPSGNLFGLVYHDDNTNGMQDPGESPYPGVLLQASNGLIATSNASGVYSFPNLQIGDTVWANPPFPTQVVLPQFWVVTLDTLGYDFGISPAPGFKDLQVDLTNTTVFRQGFTSELVLTVKNNGSMSVPNAKLGLSLPYRLAFIDAMPSAQVYGDSLHWNLGTLLAGETRVITVYVSTILGVANNAPIDLSSSIMPLAGDVEPGNNFYFLHAATVGSFDPNDKAVSPEYVTPEMLLGNKPFEYTIRFQNTGNYPAAFVRVVDTLGLGVDPASFRVVSSSHPCTWDISGAGVLKFYFDAILLPDSSSDEAGSHGFVKFAVRPSAGLALGQKVENFCDIYFDFNEPVRTNTVGTEVVYFIPGSGFPGVGDGLNVRPNPAAWQQQFSWLTPAPASGYLRYIDVLGGARVVVPVGEGHTGALADVSQLPSGIYFVALDAGNLHLTKLVQVHRGWTLGF